MRHIPDHQDAEGAPFAGEWFMDELPASEERADGWRVEFVRDWGEAFARLGDGGAATVFQRRHWLDAWYRAFGARPLIAIVANGTQRPVALIPLVCVDRGGARTIEFADLGFSDYNAPIMASYAPRDPTALRAMSAALLRAFRALPERPDLILLQKMPADIRGHRNPLVLDERTTPSAVSGNLVELGDDFGAYRVSIARLELPRRWRVFARHAGARFEVIADVDEAMRILDVMDRQQRTRMDSLGNEFVLDEPLNAEFYRDVVRRGLPDGCAVVSALICEDEVVATSMGLRDGAHYSSLRVTNAGKHWLNCSPSHLCVERTMEHLHARGVRHFDLSIGDYDYKRRFRAAPVPLKDLRIAVTWRGIPHVLRAAAERELRRHPGLVKWIRGTMAATERFRKR